MKYNLILLFIALTYIGFGQGVRSDVLDKLIERSKASHSDAIMIAKHDTILYQDFSNQSDKPIYIASAGKSLVSLAICKLIDEHFLDSLDQPVHTLFPEWRQGNKQYITIRMLLNHTSGIQNISNASVELEPAPDYQIEDIIQLALCAELSHKPGDTVSYNNKAVALLGGVVEKASGMRFDTFFETYFYAPLQIVDFGWVRDRAGNPTLHGAFIIKPSDLLKFGQLILNKGIFNNQRILSSKWIDECLSQSQPFTPIWGLLWWRLPVYERRIIDKEIWESWMQANVPESFLEKLKPLRGITFNSKQAFFDRLRKDLGEDWYRILNTTLPSSVQSSKRIYSEEILGYYADGFRGNYLVIIPKYNLVGVRCADSKNFNYQTDGFEDFVPLLAELISKD